MKTYRVLKPALLIFIVFHLTLTYVNAQIYIQDPSALRTLVSVSTTIDLLDAEDTIIVYFEPDEYFYMGITMNELDKNIAGISIKSYASKSAYKRGNVYKKNTYNRELDKHNKLKNKINYSLLTCAMQEMIIQITIFESIDLPPKRKLITVINEKVQNNKTSKKEKRTKTVKSIIELVGIVSALL